MMRDPATSGNDCTSLAVEFFRKPSRFPDLLHGRHRLPPGVTALLQIAASNRLHQENAEVDKELQQAARFFIEHVLMAHNASHYRVLGVEPTASPEEIKEHHRLLMRLYHPDRQATVDERSDAIATRINQAYTVLRYPDARATYDLSLADRRDFKSATPPRVRRPQPVTDAPPIPRMRMPPFVVRHLPQFALGSIALIAALGVMLVYVNRTPAGAIGASDNKIARASENEAARTVPRDHPPAITQALAGSGPADLPPPAVATQEETIVPVAESSGDREMTMMPASLTLASTKSASPPLVAPVRTSESKSPAPVANTQAPAATLATNVSPVTVTPPVAPEIKPVPLRQDQLNGLVASLTEQYQQGDLENLLALFDTSAHIDRGDKKQIRAEYGELFRNSENRTLYIWDMVWSSDNKVTRGEGSFQARVLHKGDRSPKIYNGAVTIEVAQRNDRPVIVGLYQKTGN